MNPDPQIESREAGASTCDEDDITGLPTLSSWRAVYSFVCVVFVVYVALLVALPSVFS